MAVNGVNVTQEDINLVLQPCQRRYAMIQVLSQNGMRMFNIDGEVISCSINIDSSSNIRRTGSISMRCTEESIKNAQQLTAWNYVRIFSGIENQQTGYVTWYNQGTFIINQQGISLSISDRTLSLTLSDKMLDFTGDRKGKLHAYSAIVEYNQRFDTVMENLVRDFGGVNEYDITPIHPTFTASAQIGADINDYLIPMKLEFSVGVTIYEILEKLINCYSDWQMFFDVDGVFVCQPSIRAQQNIEPTLYDDDIVRLKISESAELVDVTKIKNVIEVWGKDGLYYGEARDDNPNSPFAVSAVGEFREVYSGGDYDNIYDRYRDIELYTKQQEELAAILVEIDSLDKDSADYKSELKKLEKKKQDKEAEIQRNIKYKGDDMAQEWAEFLLWEKSRSFNTGTLTLIYCPFINDAGFKIVYRDDVSKEPLSYIVNTVAHDVTNNTTTLGVTRYFADVTNKERETLDVPVILSHSISGSSVTITVKPVDMATRYKLYIDNALVMTNSETTLAHDFEGYASGDYTLYVTAWASEFNESANSVGIPFTISNNAEDDENDITES